MKPVIDLSKEYGLALEGGGAKGAYQIGVWKALKEAGVRIKGVAGTSVGALNGAFICMDDLPTAEHVWENITYSQIMDVDEEQMRRLLQNEMTSKEFFSAVFKKVGEGGLDVNPLREMIHTYVREEEIRKSPIELYISTFNMDRMKELDLDLKEVEEGKMQDYLLASAYIFPLFKNEKIDGMRFVDGGVVNKIPINVLLEHGYENIIAVRIFGIGREKPVKIPEETTLIEIAAKVDLGNILDFDAARSKRNMKIGYYDAKRVIYGLSGKIYYIEENHEECYYLKQLMQISESVLLEIQDGSHLSDKGGSPLRKLTERILPAMAAELKLDKDWSYKELYLSMLEATAKICKVPKYCIYTVEELKEEICKKLEHMGKNPTELPAFVRFFQE